MRNLMFAGLAALVLAGPAPAQDGAEPAIQGVIQSQIDAFLADDFATAFTFASPMIRQMFGTPENFGRMVTQGYPMVHRPADVQFQDQLEANGRRWQKVMIRDQSGAFHLLEYEMIQNGADWQINGVRYIGAPQIGV